MLLQENTKYFLNHSDHNETFISEKNQEKNQLFPVESSFFLIFELSDNTTK